MEIGYVDEKALPVFRSLLLDDIDLQQQTILGLTEGDMACGAIAIHAMDGVARILSLYVAPAYRRKGGGRMLVEAAKKLLTGHSLELWLDHTCGEPDNSTLIPFLEAMGFLRDEVDEMSTQGLTLEQLSHNPFFEQHGSATPFAQLDPAQLTAAYQREAADGTALMSRTDFLENSDQDASMAVVRSGQPEALAVVLPHSEKLVELAWVTAADPRLMPSLLRSVADALQAKYSPDTLVAIQPVSDEAVDLLDALLPEAAPLSFSWRLPLC